MLQDAKFYSLATKFKKFSNKGKSVVIQFTVKHEQNIDCGGGYVKVCFCIYLSIFFCCFGVII